MNKWISRAINYSGEENSLLILLFHKVPRCIDPLAPLETDLEQFGRVVEFLAEHYAVLSLEEAVERMVRKSLPRRAAAITFDDGYGEWFEGPVPVLERHRMPATFFVTTEQIAGSGLWHERVLNAVAALPDGSHVLRGVSGEPIEFHINPGKVGNRASVAGILQALKYLAPDHRLDAISELEAMAVRTPRQAERFTADDIRRLRDRGFAVGAHTVTHPILTAIPDDAAQDEIGRSREELEAILREPVRMFAYPNGRPDIDYQAKHVRMVRDAGYKIAVATSWGSASPSTDLFQLPRFTPWARSQWHMAWQLRRNVRHPPQVVVGERGGDDAASAAVGFSPQHRRVLMTAFHFPPQAGSSGILRTLNFVRHLPTSGWRPTVLTAHPRAYEATQDDLIDSVPADIDVHRAQAFDAARHFSLKKKYLLISALPDRWSSWWFDAIRIGRAVIRQERPDLLWSTYPISTAHLITGALAKWSRIPWVADFRDPMVSSSFPSNAVQRAIWKRIEARTVRTATMCVFTTERAAQDYRERYPEAVGRCHVIENGYDEEAFAGVLATPLQQQRKIRVLHSGLIYPKERAPDQFLEAVSRLLRSGAIGTDQLTVKFRAPGDTKGIAELAVRYGLAGVVDVLPPIPYKEAIAEMIDADLLLVFQGKAFNAQVPAKIYEYARSMRPMLALIDPDGQTAKELRRFRGVFQADIKSSDQIEAAIAKWLQLRNEPRFSFALEENRALVQPFSRQAQAQRLAALMTGCISGVAEIPESSIA